MGQFSACPINKAILSFRKMLADDGGHFAFYVKKVFTLMVFAVLNPVS